MGCNGRVMQCLRLPLRSPAPRPSRRPACTLPAAWPVPPAHRTRQRCQNPCIQGRKLSLSTADQPRRPSMNREEQRVRDDLELLASSDRGRELLQLALRGIGRGEHAVTAGCWTDRGIAGCLFQHGYWQGVEEGIFADEGRPGDWIGSFVGSSDYGIVIRAIESFDDLARSSYSDRTERRILPDRTRVRQSEWRL